MTKSVPPAPPIDRPHGLGRDVAVVAALTLGSALLSAHYELHERVFEFTRRYERMQLDEWPIAAFVLALGLMWLAWRRYRLAAAELRARLDAEARLRDALAQNRELARRHLRALEDERKHLARELHDEFGQYLSAIRLDAAGGAGPEEEGARRRRTQRMLAAVDHLHRAAGEMMRRLRPSGLDELGLAAAVESCMEQWQQRLPGTRFSFHATGPLDELSEHVALTIYRVVQEALTNSFKHARASAVDVVLNRSTASDARSDGVVLSVADDGVGADRIDRDGGMGLRGMRERVEMLGGTLAIETAPDRGFTLEVRLPADGRL